VASASDIGKKLEQLVDEATHTSVQELLETAHFCQALIVARTKNGLDADGKPFAAYSQSYTETRQKAGYGTTPDLVRTGHMIGSMLVTANAEQATISFANAHEAEKAAAHHYGTKHLPERSWFDVRSPQDVAAVEEVMGKGIATRIEKTLK
jgi:hypothetical protein